MAGGDGNVAPRLRPTRRRRRRARFARLLHYVDDKLAPAFEHLGAARADILAFPDFPDFPEKLWQQI